MAKNTKETTRKDKIISFIKNNPYPKDEQFHAFAKKMGMDPDELEQEAYAILSDIFAQGKRNKEPEKYLDPQQIEEGIKVEKEHTTNPRIAKRIAQDHLVEIPDYYTRLNSMEAKALSKKSSLTIRSYHIKNAMEIITKMAGGPGSGSNSKVETKYILDLYPKLQMSPYLSIGKRSQFFEDYSPLYTEKKIKMDKIKYVIQEKYVPEKVKRMVSETKVEDLPIDVMVDAKGDYTVLDGHHRYLALKQRNKHEILANVWPTPKNKMAAMISSKAVGSLASKGLGGGSLAKAPGVAENVASSPLGVENILPAKALGGATNNGVKQLYHSTINK